MVMKMLSSSQLYLHCEECESGWYDPLKVDDLAAKFLTLDEDFDAELDERFISSPPVASCLGPTHASSSRASDSGE